MKRRFPDEPQKETMDTTVLVNKDNPVPPDYRDTVEMAEIEVEEGFSILLEREAAEKYLQLRERLLSLGVHVEALSGYRHQDTQVRIWNESVAAHGEAYARCYVAQPGFSEHQTGLALDLTVYDAQGNKVDDGDIEAYGEIFPHLHEYGFILRYPEGKEAVTGYPFEPWHIRYVGMEAARRIHDNNWTLEEYVSQADQGTSA